MVEQRRARTSRRDLWVPILREIQELQPAGVGITAQLLSDELGLNDAPSRAAVSNYVRRLVKRGVLEQVEGLIARYKVTSPEKLEAEIRHEQKPPRERSNAKRTLNNKLGDLPCNVIQALEITRAWTKWHSADNVDAFGNWLTEQYEAAKLILDDHINH